MDSWGWGWGWQEWKEGDLGRMPSCHCNLSDKGRGGEPPAITQNLECWTKPYLKLRFA